MNAILVISYGCTPLLPVVMSFTGDERLILGISDSEERKITCIKNTSVLELPARSEKNRFVTLSSSQAPRTQTTSTILEKQSTSITSTLTNSVNSAS